MSFTPRLFSLGAVSSKLCGARTSAMMSPTRLNMYYLLPGPSTRPLSIVPILVTMGLVVQGYQSRKKMLEVFRQHRQGQLDLKANLVEWRKTRASTPYSKITSAINLGRMLRSNNNGLGTFVLILRLPSVGECWDKHSRRQIWGWDNELMFKCRQKRTAGKLSR